MRCAASPRGCEYRIGRSRRGRPMAARMPMCEHQSVNIPAMMSRSLFTRTRRTFDSPAFVRISQRRCRVGRQYRHCISCSGRGEARAHHLLVGLRLGLHVAFNRLKGKEYRVQANHESSGRSTAPQRRAGIGGSTPGVRVASDRRARHVEGRSTDRLHGISRPWNIIALERASLAMVQSTYSLCGTAPCRCPPLSATTVASTIMEVCGAGPTHYRHHPL